MRCIDEDMYSISSYIHAVYCYADITSVSADESIISSVISKDHPLYPLLSSAVSQSITASSYKNKAVVYAAINAIIKLHMKDTVTTGTLSGGQRKAELKSPVTFVKHVLHRMKSGDALVCMSVALTMYSMVTERYK